MTDKRNDEGSQATSQQPQGNDDRDRGDAPDHPERPVPAKHSTAREEASETEADPDALVEETSKDSYPGSDAPAW